ncbi:MAG: TA system VapC family ribonuclease toxin [Spirochaetales bacterium]
MIIPDVNLLVYAHNSGVPEHVVARRWWEATVNGSEPVGLAWAAVLGFVRLLSSPAVAARPQAPEELLSRIESILSSTNVRLIAPGPDHPRLMKKLFEQSGAGSRLVTDVHLAALAIQLDATLATNDTDFARFPGLKIVNPLA